MSLPSVRNGLGIAAWVLGYTRRRPTQLAGLLASMAANISLGLLKPWPMVLLIDYALGTKEVPRLFADFSASLTDAEVRLTIVTLAAALTVLLFMLEWASGLASGYATVTLGQRLTYDVAADLFQKLQQFSLRFHRRRSVGDTIRRVTTDSGCIAVILNEALMPLLQATITLLLMFTVMSQVDIRLTALMLLVVPYMVLIFRIYSHPMLERGYLEQENEGRVYEVVERTFSAIPAVQAFGRESVNEEMFRASARGTLAAALSVVSAQLQFKILMGLAVAVGTAGILWFGGQAAMAGNLTAGAIVLFLSYLGSIYGPLLSVMYSGSVIQGAGGSARRVLEILSAEREIQDAPQAVEIQRPRGEIVFENVSFEHEPGRAVLRDVSAVIHAGETVALVGPTGAGKTTLVSLIPRFFDPKKGRVLLDGRDLRDVQLKSLRSHVALVLQEPFLFPMSVAQNIAYGRPNASQAEIESAAKAAHAHEFVSRLPEGYATVLGERGANLSGGERQRLSIARALLKDAPILILDEPTSALDAGTEALILDAMKTLIRGRTTLIIAHRLATVQHAQRILVLQDGAIVETGTHAELSRSSGLYAGYAKAQFLLPQTEV